MSSSPRIVLIEDGPEQKDAQAASSKPKPKRVKMTVNQRLAAYEAKLKQKEHNAATAKQTARNKMIKRIRDRAEEEGLNIINANIALPEKAPPKNERFNTYYKATKKKYYARAKDQLTSVQREAKHELQQKLNMNDIPVTWFAKTRSKKTVKNVVDAIMKKHKSALAKTVKKVARDDIIQYAIDKYGDSLSLKKDDDVLKIVCVRKKKNAEQANNKK